MFRTPPMLRAFAAAAVLAGFALDASTAQPIDNQYIVVLKAPRTGLLQTTTSVSQTAQTLLAQVGGGEVLAEYKHALRGFAARISPAQARMLAGLPGVQWVEQDQVMTSVATQSGATWGLDRIDQRNMPLNGSYVYADQAGQGAHVYVIDTGLNAAHVEFTGRVAAGRNFAPNTEGTAGQPLADLGLHPAQLGVPLNLAAVDLGTGLLQGPTDPADTTDCNGHGTHVAGTAAGTTYGVAKKATVHAVRVLGCSGSGANSGVIAGVDWVAANRVLPAVANMSLGGGDSPALDTAVNNAIARGVSFVVAAGNSTADACSGSPNKVPAAITVGSTTNTDARSSFSNFGSCVDIFAPGSDITSAWYTGATATNTISGTSMASPHVAGAAALVLGANPAATPAQVTDALLGNATLGKVSDPGDGSPNTLLYTGN